MHDHHDHSHDPITAAIQETVAKQITNPIFVQSLLGATLEQVGNATTAAAERMRPVAIQEALVKPQPYNEVGDSLLLIRRRLHHVDNSCNVVMTFSQTQDGQTTYTSTLYKDHPFDTAGTKFIEFASAEAEQEFHRQVAEMYKADWAGKSMQLTVVFCKRLFPEVAEKDEGQPRLEEGDTSYDDPQYHGHDPETMVAQEHQLQTLQPIDEIDLSQMARPPRDPIGSF